MVHLSHEGTVVGIQYSFLLLVKVPTVYSMIVDSMGALYLIELISLRGLAQAHTELEAVIHLTD